MSLKKKFKGRFSGWVVKQYETEFVCDRSLEEIWLMIDVLAKDKDYLRYTFPPVFRLRAEPVIIGVERSIDLIIDTPSFVPTLIEVYLQSEGDYQTRVVLVGMNRYSNLLPRAILYNFWSLGLTSMAKQVFPFAIVISLTLIVFFLATFNSYKQHTEKFKLLLLSKDIQLPDYVILVERLNKSYEKD